MTLNTKTYDEISLYVDYICEGDTSLLQMFLYF